LQSINWHCAPIKEDSVVLEEKRPLIFSHAALRKEEVEWL
jgi:hypothetical protein